MLCSRFLKLAPRREARPVLSTSPSASDENVLDGYERTLRWVMDHRGEVLVFSGLVFVGTGVLFDGDAEGLHPERGQRISCTERPRRRRARRSTRWSRTAAGRRDHRKPTRTSPTSCRRWAAAARRTRSNHGRVLHAPQAARPTQPVGRPDSCRSCERNSRDPGHARLPAESAGDQIGGRSTEEPLSVHDAERRHQTTVSRGATSSWRACKDIRWSAGRDERSAAQAIRR